MVLTAVFVVLVFLYRLVSRRLQPTVITAPMLFTAAGAATNLLPVAARELVLDRTHRSLTCSGAQPAQHRAQSRAMGRVLSRAHPEVLADQLTAHTAAAVRDRLRDGSA
jgi:hypothetical protein